MMPGGYRNVYGVYKQGELVTKGFCTEIREMLHVSSNYLFKCAEKGKEIDGCIVKIIGTAKQKVYYQGKKKKFDPIDYLYRHLKEYGNTCLKDDPAPYIEELEQMLDGKVNVFKRYDTDNPYNYELNLSKPGKYRKGRKDYYYILELNHGIQNIQE